MVLAADIVDGMGRLLLPAGTTLTDKHLRYCQMWGVMEADIEGSDFRVDADDAIDQARLSAVEPDVRLLFRHCDTSHPAVDALFRYCVRARARRRA